VSFKPNVNDNNESKMFRVFFSVPNSYIWCPQHGDRLAMFIPGNIPPCLQSTIYYCLGTSPTKHREPGRWRSSYKPCRRWKKYPADNRKLGIPSYQRRCGGMPAHLGLHLHKYGLGLSMRMYRASDCSWSIPSSRRPRSEAPFNLQVLPVFEVKSSILQVQDRCDCCN
jgi:hypothetical protein